MNQELKENLATKQTFVANLFNEMSLLRKTPNKYLSHLKSQSLSHPHSFETAKNNPERNRYQNVLANDNYHFRCPEIDYINADVVDSNEVNRKYILSQGPICGYMYEFFEMINFSGTECVVCLSNQVENGITKFDQYYCDFFETVYLNSTESSLFRVSVLSKVTNESIITRKISIIKETDGNIVSNRVLTHIMYHDWPDNGVPTNVTNFLKIFEYISCFNSPILVHCSAGIGRTGTFVVISEIIEDLKRKGLDTINIIDKIILMRKFRYGLVQNLSQVNFCYKSVISFVALHF